MPQDEIGNDSRISKGSDDWNCNKMAAGSGEMGVVFIFLLGRKAGKAVAFFFFLWEDSSLGEGLSEEVAVLDAALVCLFDTEVVVVCLFLL